MIEYRNKLELAEYIAVAEIIADGFFDVAGQYAPHYGALNAYRMFYNMCVTKSKYDEQYGHEIGLEEAAEIISDDEFISKFDTCVRSDCGGLTFSAAYRAAMEMVWQRKSSIGSAVTLITSLIKDIAEKINNVMSGDNLARIETIANDIKEGKLSADAVVEAYGKKLAARAEEQFDAPEINVVPKEQEEPQESEVENGG